MFIELTDKNEDKFIINIDFIELFQKHVSDITNAQSIVWINGIVHYCLETVEQIETLLNESYNFVKRIK